MIRHFVFKKITFLLLLLSVLMGCSNDLIRPDDKHIEAMIQVNTEASNQQVLLLKIKSWMKSRTTVSGADIEYVNTTANQVNGKGVVTTEVRGDSLRTQYLITVKVISPNLVYVSIVVLRFCDLLSRNSSHVVHLSHVLMSQFYYLYYPKLLTLVQIHLSVLDNF